MTGFATIDFETTGLFPSKHDRAIEVAVVHSDPDGTITGRWETLINPGRDLGPQRIHAIRAADVRSAPTFADIAAELVELLSGRVVVAHNASFDQRFLLAELDRIAYWAPQFDPLCTMRLARDILPGAGRSLADCCAAFDIDLADAHRASADAFATAQLLEAYIASTSDWGGWAYALAEAQPWAPHEAPRLAWFSRDEVSTDEPADFLERITVKLPEHAGPAEHQDYLALLDRCLIDRHLSATEADALVTLAESLGISRDTAARLHADYFDALTGIAWADGVLTESELADLIAVASLLRIADAQLASALIAPAAADPVAVAAFTLEPGDQIVLTGEMTRPRAEIELDLIASGFMPKSAITKKTKLLVAADPDSLSGKARKAREYGVAVVGEAWLNTFTLLRPTTSIN